MIPVSALNQLLRRFASGQSSGGFVGKEFIRLCVTSVGTTIMDSLSSVLPLGLTVAGAILVVNLGWRLFRNFTKG